jgi:acetoin utilization deacetylase AcuC-like enzyme
MVTVYYSPAYVGASHSFDTTRKSGWIADSLAVSPIEGIELMEPMPLTEEQVAAVHDPEYVRAVKVGEPIELACSQGFDWDPGIWTMVLASNGGTVAAALAAWEFGVAGSLSSGLHHARRGRGAGFCTFNGLVIAAREVLAAGARSVLILDLDAHCGGGTASLIADDPRIWQVDVSVNSFDSYRGTERIRLDHIRDANEYLPTIENRLAELDSQGVEFDLCLYNAGMDPFEDCDTGGRRGITREILAQREQMVFDWCRRRTLPMAFVLAGGYIGDRLEKDGVVELHRLTLSAAARM